MQFSGAVVCPDNDNDGVNDVCDLDDDNDGILDVVECPAVYSLSVFPAFTDVQGRIWETDFPYVSGGSFQVELATITNLNSGHDIGTTSDADLYTYSRNAGLSGSFSYALPIDNGNYTVVFHWADPSPTGNTRSINIDMEGTTVISNYNPQNEFGISVAAVSYTHLTLPTICSV